MEPEPHRRKIEETVVEILKTADLEKITLYNVRIKLSEQLNIDFSDLNRKRLVQQAVDSYLLSLPVEETKKDVQEQPDPTPKSNFNPQVNRENIDRIICKMYFFLNQLNIAYVVTEPSPSIPLHEEASSEKTVQAKAAARKWIDDDYLCRRNILNSLSDHLFDQYSKKVLNAKELWEEVKISFNEDFGTKRSQVNKYIQFQMVDVVSVVEQVQELHNISDSIIASGMWIDEDFHVSAIVSKLPPSWKECRVKLMQEEFLPMNKLMYTLRVEEESRNRYRNSESSKNARTIELKL